MEEQQLPLDEMVKDAQNSGVGVLNNVCADIDEINYLLEISDKYDNVFCTVGQHPENVNGKIASAEFLVEKTKYKKVIGIGESGLDYHYADGNKLLQRKNFENHIEACQRAKLPLIIHSRDCDRDMIDMLRQEMKNCEFRFVLHCFCSGRELAYAGLDLGGFISFSGILTFKNSLDLQVLAKEIGLNRVLVETDAPFLAPIPFRGKVNRPSYVVKTAEFLGMLLNKSFEEVRDATTGNFFELFDKALFF
jgi:TatD DNase family protein